jgi:hypothetical protein
MASRLLAASLCITLAAALAACQSSGRYGTPPYAAAAVGAGAVGAAVSRAAGGCLALCTSGTRCNRVTGLCEPEPASSPASPVPATARAGRPAPVVTTNVSYPPGHEYEVPPLSSDLDAGCAPAAHGDAGPVACEMDGGTI